MTATAHISLSVPDHRKRSCRQKPHRSFDEESLPSSGKETVGKDRPNAEDLRRIRAEFYTTSPEVQRTKNPKLMAEKATPRRSSSARKPSTRVSEITVQEVRDIRSLEHRHRRRRTRVEKDDAQPEPAYVYRPKPVITHSPPLQRSKTTTTTGTARPKEVRRSSEGLARRQTERRKLYHREDAITVKRVARTPPEPESHLDTGHRRHSMNRYAVLNKVSGELD